MIQVKFLKTLTMHAATQLIFNLNCLTHFFSGGHVSNVETLWV